MLKVSKILLSCPYPYAQMCWVEKSRLSMLQYPNSLLGPHPVNCLKLPTCSLQSMVQDMSLSPYPEKSLPRSLLKSLQTPE